LDCILGLDCDTSLNYTDLDNCASNQILDIDLGCGETGDKTYIDNQINVNNVFSYEEGGTFYSTKVDFDMLLDGEDSWNSEAQLDGQGFDPKEDEDVCRKSTGS